MGMDERFDELRAVADENQVRKLNELQNQYHAGEKVAGDIINGAANVVGDVISGVGKALTEPPPPPKSSGGGLGGLLALGVLAGGAYLASKVFGGDDKKSSSGNKNNASSYLKSGNTYLNQQKYELAIQEFSKAIQLSPNYALAYKGRGRCYQALGDNKNAQADFSTAKRLKKKG